MYEEFLRSADERIDRVNENILLIQRKDGLTFGTDALLLAAFLRKMPFGIAAELGGGTGIVSLLCAARKKFAKICAVEVQPVFSDLIERNAALNGFSDRIFPICKNIKDLTFSDLSAEADVVFTNPPYLRANSGKKNDCGEKAIARHEILGGISDFCQAASRILKYGGLFCAVYRSDRMAELLCAMQEAGITPKRLLPIYPDTASAPVLFLIEGKKGAAPGMRFEKPLFMYADTFHTVYTEDFQYIYDQGCMKE